MKKYEAEKNHGIKHGTEMSYHGTKSNFGQMVIFDTMTTLNALICLLKRHLRT